LAARSISISLLANAFAIVGESKVREKPRRSLLNLLPPQCTLVDRCVDGRDIPLGSARTHCVARTHIRMGAAGRASLRLHPAAPSVGSASYARRCAIPGIARDITHAESRCALSRTIELPAADTLLARHPHELSGGQRQRDLHHARAHQ
jgi:ABC-type glutathione transport system ATPase component